MPCLKNFLSMSSWIGPIWRAAGPTVYRDPQTPFADTTPAIRGPADLQPFSPHTHPGQAWPLTWSHIDTPRPTPVLVFSACALGATG